MALGRVMPNPTVIAVASDSAHNVIKPVRESISLIAGLGIEGDAHAGKTIQHRYDKARNPDAPNLRQVHLMHAELFDQMAELGMTVTPGQMGENITTRNIDILGVPRGTHLKIGEAIIEITGLRNPCKHLNKVAVGLMEACIERYDDGALFPQSGVMGIVIAGGEIKVGDDIQIITPDKPYSRLEPV